MRIIVIAVLLTFFFSEILAVPVRVARVDVAAYQKEVYPFEMVKDLNFGQHLKYNHDYCNSGESDFHRISVVGDITKKVTKQITEKLPNGMMRITMKEVEEHVPCLRCRIISQDDNCIYGRRVRHINFVFSDEIPVAQFDQLKERILKYHKTIVRFPCQNALAILKKFGHIHLYNLVKSRALKYASPNRSIPPELASYALANKPYKKEKYVTPFFRYNHKKVKDHHYTIYNVKRRLNRIGYSSEGIAAYILSKPQPNSVPFYRYYSSKDRDHYFSTKKVKKNGYKYEGVAGHVYSKFYGDTQSGKLVPLYQYYSQQLKDHFYTTNKEEIASTFGTISINGGYLGYNYMGVAAFVYEPCTELRVSNWNGNIFRTCIKEGRKKLVSKSVYHKRTRSCRRHRSWLTVQKQKGAFRVNYLNRCSKKWSHGKFVNHGYSIAKSQGYKVTARKFDYSGRNCFGEFQKTTAVFTNNKVKMSQNCIRVLGANYNGKDVTFIFGEWVNKKGGKKIHSHINMVKVFGGSPNGKLTVSYAYDK
eukprot:gene6209-10215_t